MNSFPVVAVVGLGYVGLPYGVSLTAWDDLPRADAIVAAVAHREYRALGIDRITARLADDAWLHRREGRVPASRMGRARIARLAPLSVQAGKR